MENGFDGKSLAKKFSGLVVSTVATEQSNTITNSKPNSNSSNNDSNLFQVMKAVEAAEATIKQQAEENYRLRIELQKKIQEMEGYNLGESLAQGPNSAVEWSESNPLGSFGAKQSVTPIGSEGDIGKSNGTLNALSDVQKRPDLAGLPQFSSSSTTSSYPRFQVEGDYDPQFNMSGNGLMPMAEVNNPNGLWKQDLSVKIQEHEEEIAQLRRHLADYSVKEAQVRNEKYVLEKRIAYMRLAFDQQQQDLVDAASKALSYRQDIIEENIRLTYALQDSQQERSTFISSLMPLLADYSLQPQVPDAQSIVSNVKVLFKHLQEKLLLTESKLKESQYQLTPWRLDLNQSNFAPQSPYHSKNNGLELVPQPSYSNGKIPISSSDAQTTLDWDLSSRRQSGLESGVARDLESDILGRYPHLESRPDLYNVPAKLDAPEDHNTRGTYVDEMTSKQVTFRVPFSSSGMDDPDEVNQIEREPPVDDPGSSYAPYLSPVLEEPSSSFSEAADDDPLPAIEGLQISGEAFPGQELQACGYSINGTTSCNFEWVRHLEDGSVNYIDGAKQPNYLVSADDVDTYLAIEVQPLDNRKRKGELVKVFANEHRKITCDSEMQNQIEKTLYSGHASYKVSLSTGYLDIWEPATLAIKKEGLSVKCSGPSGVVVTEKFSPNTSVTIPYGHPTEFLLISSGGVEHHLRADNSSADISYSRDTIVLTLRLFILRANERRKGKKKSIFFNK